MNMKRILLFLALSLLASNAEAHCKLGQFSRVRLAVETIELNADGRGGCRMESSVVEEASLEGEAAVKIGEKFTKEHLGISNVDTGIDGVIWGNIPCQRMLEWKDEHYNSKTQSLENLFLTASVTCKEIRKWNEVNHTLNITYDY